MKVLIVDDSSFSQRILSSLIKKYLLDDTQIHYAKDGEEGLEQYKRINPDYTFVDLLMPKLNGTELIKLIKKYDDSSKIIVVSADVQKSTKEELELYGILEFFNKPFNDENAKYICKIIGNQYGK